MPILFSLLLSITLLTPPAPRLTGPATFVYNKQTWTISYVPQPIPKDKKICNTGYCDGVTYCPERHIDLNTQMTTRERKRVLIHELEHVVTHCRSDSQPVHPMIYETSQGLETIIDDNQLIREFLFQKAD